MRLRNRVDKLLKAMADEEQEIKIVRKVVYRENGELKTKVINERTVIVGGKAK